MIAITNYFYCSNWKLNQKKTISAVINFILATEVVMGKAYQHPAIKETCPLQQKLTHICVHQRAVVLLNNKHQLLMLQFGQTIIFEQGVVTSESILPVEKLTTGIKIQSSDQDSFHTESSNQGICESGSQGLF